MKKYLFRFLLKDKIYLEKMISRAEREIANLKEQISKKDNQIEFLQTLIIRQNENGLKGQVSILSNISTNTKSKAVQETSKAVNVVPITKRFEAENKTQLEKQTTDIDEGTLEDVLDHFDPMNSSEIALLY